MFIPVEYSIKNENGMGQGMTADIALSISLAAGFGLTAIYVAIARRHRSTWRIGVVVLLACAEITLAYTLRSVSVEFSDRVFWYKMSLVGFAISTSSFFSLALQYTKSKSALRPRTLLLLSVFPLLTTALILTNEFHGLIWDPTSTSQIVEKTLFPSVNEAGIWYWIFVAYSFFIMGLGCFILIQWIIQSRGFYSRQALGVIVAAILAFLGSALDIFRVSPMEPFIATALGLACGTITVAFALNPLRRHDILNVSRGAIIDGIDDCVIVVDEDNRIALINPAAQKLVGKPESQVISRALEQSLPGLGSSSAFRLNQNGEVTLNIEAMPHTFDMHISTIHDWQGRIVSRIIVLRDITERHQGEKILQRYQLLSQNTRDIILFIRVRDGQILEANNAAIQAYGYEPQYLLTKNIRDLHAPETLHLIDEQIDQANANGIFFETLHCRKDGSIFPVEVSSSGMMLDNERVLLSIARDITERKQMEQDLLLTQFCIDQASIGIMRSGPNAEILSVNQQCCQYLGYSTQEFCNMHIYDIDPGFHRREHQDFIRQHGFDIFETIYRRKNGTTFQVEVTTTYVSFQSSEFSFSFIRDITGRKQAEQALLRSEITLAEAQRISHLGSWEWDLQSGEIQFSDEMFRIVGLLPGELEVTRDVFLKFLHPEEAEEIFHEIQNNATYPSAGIEHRVIWPKGEIRKVHSWIKAYRDQNGKPLRLLGSTQDITERKEYEAQILLQATALESAVNGIMITDADGKVLWANSSLKQMTGYALIELIGVYPPFFGKAPRDINCYEDLLEIIRTKRSWQGEVSNVRKDGTGFIAEMSFTPVIREGGKITHYIAICQDISERIEAKEKLEYLATHDVLTGLPNRLLFSDRLNHALAMANRTGGQGAILLIDLDDFKAINDTFSHDDGDEFLKLMAGRIENCIRESDTVARIGGDEFTVLLENIEHNDVIIVAQKLNWAISEKATIRGNTIVSTASIGIGMFPQDGDAVQQLIKNADLAMYQAKEHKNSFRFYGHEMSVRIEKQMELTGYLRHALQNDVFELYYQPQVNSITGKVTRMEALLRLPHPEKKWISPAEFIPIAEKTGLITSIDEWVLRTACRKLGELVDIGYPDIIMAVNLSTRQLNQPNLFTLLQTVIKENKINPGCLELEISEGSIFQNMDTAFRTMSKLKAMGIKLAIDDFGTGYSSLNYLSYFPLDTLKIDLSFTKKILFSKSDAAIVTGVIAIAHNLGLNIIVEGVEKKEQLKFFSILECHLIQGFIFSPAVPGSEIINLLNKGFMQSNSGNPEENSETVL